MIVRLLAVAGIASLLSSSTLADSTFAVIGDFGDGSANEASVANLVNSWNPDFIVTAGDDNYPTGGADTIDAHIGQFYHGYIGNYGGAYGAGAAENRFWPALGNHDWGNAYPNPTGAAPYLSYFTLPGNERYYDFAPAGGNVRFFVLDSDRNEPDSPSSAGTQGQWLKTRLAQTTESFKVVVFHHAAYSSCSNHGSQSYMQWPFAQWGATAVMAGHDHTYERLEVHGLPYFVNGVGGSSLYTFGTPLPESQSRLAGSYGAMKVTTSANQMVFGFYTTDGTLQDSFTQNLPAPVNSITRSYQQGAILADNAAVYTGARDTYVDGSNPTASNATSTKLVADNSPVNQVLLRFENIFGHSPNQIPPGATIRYANLRLITGSDANDNSGSTTSLYRMTTNWNDSSTYASLVNGVNIGVETLGSPEFSVDPEYLGLAMNFDVTLTVQQWADDALANIDSNFGWALLSSGTDGWRFASSEFATLAERPLLEITYVPEPAGVGTLMGAGVVLCLCRKARSSPRT